jgi:hypothetical protein
MEVVATRIARACTGRRVRDLATTRSGTVNYALLRMTSRRVMDRLTTWKVRQQAKGGRLDGSPLAGELARALTRRTAESDSG